MKKLVLSLIILLSASAPMLSAPCNPKGGNPRAISSFENLKKVRARRKKKTKEKEKWHKANIENAEQQGKATEALDKALEASLKHSQRTYKKFKPVSKFTSKKILKAEEVLKAKGHIKKHCKKWDKEFYAFMSTHPEASAAVLTAAGIQLNHKFDFAHLLTPSLTPSKTKIKKISGYHIADVFPKAITIVKQRFPHSMNVVLSLKDPEGKIFTKSTTIFTPDRKKQEIIELFYKSCMNIQSDTLTEDGSSHKVRSEKIDGQQYEFILDKKGKVRTFYPVN